MLLVSPFYTFIRFLFQAYGALTRKGASGKFVEENSKIELLKILFSAYFAAIKGIGMMLKKRKKIRLLKKVSDAEIYRWFEQFGISAREIALKE